MEDNSLKSLLIFTVLVLASYADSFYVYPKMLSSARNLQSQCDSYPEQCWIKEKKHA